MAFALPDWISAKPETYLRARESGAEAGLGAQRLWQSARDSAAQHALESQRLASVEDAASQRAAIALAELQMRQEIEQQKIQSAAEKLAANQDYQDRVLSLREGSLEAKASMDAFRQTQLEAGLKQREEGITIRQELLKLQQDAAKNKLDEATAKKAAELENEKQLADLLISVEDAYKSGTRGEELLAIARAHPNFASLAKGQQDVVIASIMRRDSPTQKEMTDSEKRMLAKDYYTALNESRMSGKLGDAARQHLAWINQTYPGMFEQQPATLPATGASTNVTSGSKTLTVDQARNFLRQSGGDRKKAEDMARQAGFTF